MIRVRFRAIGLGLAFLVGLCCALGQPAVVQGQDDLPDLFSEPVEEAAPAPSPQGSREQFFADVLVRGRPVLQVGSLEGLSALDRAQRINRRIAGLLNQQQAPEAITVNIDPAQELATLQISNRVLMTVTSQDALDFGTTVPALAEAWANDLNQAMQQPNLAVDVAQRLQGTSRLLVNGLIENLPFLLGALLVMILTWLVALIVRRGALLWAERTEGDRNTELLIGRLCYGGVWVLGAIVALGIMGLNFTALLGTLGLTSVAIGFSLRDILSNYISGVILLAARPFRIGDQIVVKAYEGTITQIQLRATTLQTYDGRLVYIPNQEMFRSSITNNTASPVRRSSAMVGISYEADIEKATAIIRGAVAQVDGVESLPDPMVLVRELGPSTVKLEIWFWVNSRRQSFLEVTSRVLQAIKSALEGANIDMPTEIYTVILQPNAANTADETAISSELP
jgi:small conductance mechanosensitive channel